MGEGRGRLVEGILKMMSFILLPGPVANLLILVMRWCHCGVDSASVEY